MTTTSLVWQAADLHYYVVHDGAGEPEGLLAEEFLLLPDYSSAGLVSAGWTRPAAHWRDASATSHRLRTDAALRARVAPASRTAAATLYRDLCGADLPDEAALRACFGDLPGQPPPPLRLGRAETTPGFRETRLYRLLFTEAWHVPVTADLAVHRQIAGDVFRWELRRVAAGAAWAVDVTCDLVGDRDDAVGVLLRGLTARMRWQGMIPVTVDRFR